MFNISMITGTPHTAMCWEASRSLLEVTYEMMIIFGVFPAIMTGFVVLVAICFLPSIIYFYYRNRQLEVMEMNTTKMMVNSLMRTKFDSNLFQSQESCMICLINFNEDSLVTPLPCDIRHYFHTDCIEQWLMINSSCPLCKAVVTTEEIERVADMYMLKLN